MLDLQRLREILPFAFAIYLLTSMLQSHATPHHWRAEPVAYDKIWASVKWHMEQIGENEQLETTPFEFAN